MAVAFKRGDTELMISARNFFVKEVSKEDRILRFIGSDETPDRDRDIIEVNGWDLKNFRLNPVFLWAHDYKTPPIGRAVKVQKADGKLVFDIKFPDEGMYPFADLIYNLYKGGFMNATSVGFIPKQGKTRDDPEVADLPEWQRGHRYSKQELLELSAVPVPSNPAAVQIARSKGYLDDNQATAISDLMSGKFNKDVAQMAFKGLEQLMKAGKEVEELFNADEQKQADVNVDNAEVLYEESEVKTVDTEQPQAGEPADSSEKKEPKPAVPVKILAQIKTVKNWECPHCQKIIGEKSLFNDGEHFYHSPCKEAGPILLPSDEEMKSEDVTYAKIGPVSVDSEKGLLTIDIEGVGSRSYTFAFLRELDVVSAQKAGAVLSKKNRDALTNAKSLIDSVLAAATPAEENGAGTEGDDAGKAGDPEGSVEKNTSQPEVKDGSEQTEVKDGDEPGENTSDNGETDVDIDIEIEDDRPEEQKEIDLSGFSSEDLKSAISGVVSSELKTARGVV